MFLLPTVNDINICAVFIFILHFEEGTPHLNVQSETYNINKLSLMFDNSFSNSVTMPWAPSESGCALTCQHYDCTSWIYDHSTQICVLFYTYQEVQLVYQRNNFNEISTTLYNGMLLTLHFTGISRNIFFYFAD